MNGINSNTDVKSSKKGLIYFLIAVIFLILGVGLGFGITKYLDKEDTKEEIKKEEKADVEEAKESEKVVNEFKDKAVDLTKFKEYKKDVLNIELNGKSLELVTIYYTGNKQIAKSVTFNDVKIVQDYILFNDVEDKFVDKYIKDDMDYTVKTMNNIKDTKSDERYLIYYNKNYSLIMKEQGDNDPWYQYVTKASVVSENGKVLFNGYSEESLRSEWLVVSDKSDILDRDYIKSECDPEEERNEDDVICDGYILYKGKENNDELEYLRGSEIEFKEDHFYTFKYRYGEDKYVSDYKYSIENGSLKEELLKKYEISKHLDAAGAE